MLAKIIELLMSFFSSKIIGKKNKTEDKEEEESEQEDLEINSLQVHQQQQDLHQRR